VLRWTELWSWFQAFAFTQLIEVPIYWLALRKKSPQRLLKCFGATAITHPIVWFVIPTLWEGDYWWLVVVAESFAVIVEAVYLTMLGVSRWRAWLWSLAANGASVGLGFLVYWWHGLL
jgi:hypothetical protein